MFLPKRCEILFSVAHHHQYTDEAMRRMNIGIASWMRQHNQKSNKSLQLLCPTKIRPKPESFKYEDEHEEDLLEANSVITYKPPYMNQFA